jgi:hypothetical protein
MEKAGMALRLRHLFLRRCPDVVEPVEDRSGGIGFDGDRWGWLVAAAAASRLGTWSDKEATVDERSRVLMATCMGAVIGGVWGWLYLTEGGRRVRSQIEPRLDDFMNELTNVRSTVNKARTAANEGWRSLSDMTGGASGGRWSA